MAQKEVETNNPIIVIAMALFIIAGISGFIYLGFLGLTIDERTEKYCGEGYESYSFVDSTHYNCYKYETKCVGKVVNATVCEWQRVKLVEPKIFGGSS